MPTDTVQTIAARILADAQLLQAAVGAPPVVVPPVLPPGLPIATPVALDLALSDAVPGAILVLDRALVYLTPLTIKVPVTLTTAYPGGGRMTRGAPLPSFRKGITITAPDVSLVEIEVTHSDPTQTLIAVRADRVTLTRVRALGDPVKGAKRGIEGNGGALVVRGCYVADCFGPYPGDDCQAFCAWSTPGPITLLDNYLEGSTETVLIGGADPVDEAHVPSHITIQGNTITKNPAWQTLPIGVKNTLELKNARTVLIEDNDISESWGGHGQDGYLLMLTPRNQNGAALYSGVEDVVVQNNRFAHGAAAIAILGTDNIHPSLRLARVQILKNAFTDLDPAAFTGSNRMILIVAGPKDVTIDSNTFAGVNIGSQVYFDGAPKCDALVVTNNTWPKSKYGIFGTGATVGQAWAAFVASGTIAGNTEV